MLPEAAALVAALRTQKKTLAAAESCTGGLVSAAVVDVPGASAVFPGGVVSYANEVKESALGVPHEILETVGAVSEETARAMARGVRLRLGADYGVSTTGIAGPDGGTPENPVGTVWIGLSSAEKETAFCLRLTGLDRDGVRREAVLQVMKKTLAFLGE